MTEKKKPDLHFVAKLVISKVLQRLVRKISAPKALN
jgi:hypothetical protein